MYDGKIWITDWHDHRHEMTPNDLLERIRSDSKSNYNWLAPATEIVKTISDPEFPEPIANELKGIILKCFAELLSSDRRGAQKSTDRLAVAYCYYSVYGKVGRKVKYLYWKRLLDSAIKDWYQVSPLGVKGKKWRKFRDSWKKDALQHFTERFGTDFMRFEANIKVNFRADFEKFIRYTVDESEDDGKDRYIEKLAKDIWNATI